MNKLAAHFTPGGRLAAAAALGLPLTLLGGGGLGLGAALAFDALMFAGALIDSRLLHARVPRVTRRTTGRLVVGIENTVSLDFHNSSSARVRLTVRDEVPAEFHPAPERQDLVLPPFARRTLTYRVKPERRGQFEFGDIHLRIEGPVGLGALMVQVPARADARVFPNVLGPRRFELAARLGDLRSMGYRNVRRVGGGGEFEQLREYVHGDAYRDFDWKSTAKRQRPITRVYQQEKSQIVMLAVDAGRMMATRLSDLTKLDHAINAALLLAYVALREGDRVGLIVFADSVQHFVAPGRGPGQYRKILDALYRTEARPTYVDFRRLVEFIQVRMPRRALLVLFSDLLDEAQAQPLAENAALLKRKHLPVCVTMHDPVARQMADAAVTDDQGVYVRAAAIDVLHDREQIKAELSSKGVGVVEAPPGELAAATVNRYLEIKARHAL